MSSKSDYRGYTSLAAIVARLGEGAESKLADAHIEGRLHLAGYRRDRSGVADEEEIIPPHALKGWKPGGKGAVRFNLKTNSVEANASAGRRTRGNSKFTAKQTRELQAAFTIFERRAPYGWEDVGAPAHEVDKLLEFLRADESIEEDRKGDATPAKQLRQMPETATARDAAIRIRLRAGERPGKNIAWKQFHRNILNDCDAAGSAMPNGCEWGFSERTVHRRVDEILQNEQDI